MAIYGPLHTTIIMAMQMPPHRTILWLYRRLYTSHIGYTKVSFHNYFSSCTGISLQDYHNGYMKTSIPGCYYRYIQLNLPLVIMTIKDPTQLTIITAWKKYAACYISYISASTLTDTMAIVSQLLKLLSIWKLLYLSILLCILMPQ
jgi:hypothetical protein